MTTATGWSKARVGLRRSLVPTAMPAATTMPTTARPRTSDVAGAVAVPVERVSPG